MMKRVLALAVAAALASACASPRPKFYPNDYYKTTGEDQAKKDTDECLAKAKAYIKEHPVQQAAKKTGIGAVTGALIGAAVGLILGDFKGAIESGAAAGGIGGAASGAVDANKPGSLVRAYTDRCLAEKGYAVLGWD
jgi:outer membrane lipoprotein SlyB